MRSPRGARRVALSEFFTAYRATQLAPDEMIAGVLLPMPAQAVKSGFIKLGARRAQAIAKVSLAARLDLDKGVVREARLAAGSVAPIPLRLTAVEGWLIGRVLDGATVEEARALAQAAVAPIDDVRSTAEYRAHALGALTAKLLNQLAGRK
jgi:CO/xanthine dehydrogenase FAD-binding subunit